MADDDWTVDDNWHDEASLQLALPEAVLLCDRLLTLCKTIDWEKLENSSRPNAIRAHFATQITALIQETRDRDAKKLDQAAASLEDKEETNKKLRWLNHCLARTITCSIALARELLRTDNAHHGRRARAENALHSTIKDVTDAWQQRA